MTFEEKLAAQGRKMDELKAKLDEVAADAKAARQMSRDQVVADLAQLDAAIDELDAALDAQMEKQYETLEAEAQKQKETLSAAVSLAEEEIEKEVAKTKAAFTLDRETAEAIASEPSGIDMIQKGTEEQICKAKGDISAAEENVRLVKERNESKRNSVRIRAQMGVDNAKAKIAEKKEAVDKAAEEELILDLLDYAGRCQDLAYAWALEADYAVMDALDVIDDYTEKYGKEE